ncbi:MAG TPA: S9 family peptidase [Ignavibacteria bacterium]|nr:S9 family peptidase [Ignavibacteria bacterium]
MSTKKKKKESVVKYPVEQFYSVRTITGYTLSPDNKTIYYITNTTGSPQIWSIPVNGGWATQITLWNQPVRDLMHSPGTNNILFLSDRDGNENHQIFMTSNKGGEVEYLSDGFEDSQTFYTDFNKKGNKLLFISNKRLKYNFDTYIKDLKSGENKLVRAFDEKVICEPSAWSPDEKHIVYSKVYSNSEHDLFLYDIDNDSFKQITGIDGEERGVNSNAKFNNKGTGFYYLSDSGREFIGIKYYDIKKDSSKWFLKSGGNIEVYKISKDGKYMVYVVNKNASKTPHLINLKTGKKVKLRLPKGNYSNVNITSDNKKLVFILDSPLNPSDIYTYNIKTKRLKQITFSLVGGINKQAFTKPKDVYYKSFDDLEIHALLYIPKGLKKDGSNPAILWPHGGPEAQEMHNFSKYIQIYCNNGYIVIAPNFRGSTGYGKNFQKMIYRDFGGAEYLDVLKSMEVLEKSGYVNMGKVAIVGGSFGGFMVLTCITRAPDLWKCAIDIFGPSNLVTFANSVPEHWKEGVARLVGDVEKDRKFLEERSPINYIDNIKCPLLVMQGKHDPRVVENESVQIVDKLRKNGKEVEYVLFEDEGHGFSKVTNTIKAFKTQLEFLDKYLR